MPSRLSILLICLFVLGLQVPGQGQICTGSLGENIFTAGDFGRGFVNVLPVNPGIAPGYLYETNPPPNDGYYTITNDISPWGGIFGWLGVQDNSTNPQGYMMVVNASFDPGLFYSQLVEGLCENTTYTFSADIINLIPSGSNFIRPNVSFQIDGNNVFNTGDIPENNSWITYGFNFTTSPNQTSVVLSLANNAPGGIGNDIALDNISFRPCGPLALVAPETSTFLCEDGSPFELEALLIGNQYPTPVIQWQESTDNGNTWTDIPGATALTYTHTQLAAGDYLYRYVVANSPGNLANSKCRVISEIKVVSVLPKEYLIEDTICDGLSFSVGSSTYTTSGIYLDSLISSRGCDSIVTLNLTVEPDPDIQADIGLFDPTCSDRNDGRITWDNISGGTPPYSPQLNGDILFPGGIVDGLAPGQYQFSLVDAIGCRLDTLADLTGPPPFVIDLGPDWEIQLGDSIEINVTTNFPIDRYNWTPAEAANCTEDCNPLVYLAPGTGPLILDAVSEAGCEATDSVFIGTTPVYDVFIPTAFTPDGDGLNDEFLISANFPAAQLVTELQIYDRWGGIVYAGRDLPLNQPGSGWDGTANGRTAPEGVYVYAARVLFLDGETRRFVGSLTLLR